MTKKELKFEGVSMVQDNHKKNGGRKLNSWEFGYRKDIFLTRVGEIFDEVFGTQEEAKMSLSWTDKYFNKEVK